MCDQISINMAVQHELVVTSHMPITGFPQAELCSSNTHYLFPLLLTLAQVPALAQVVSQQGLAQSFSLAASACPPSLCLVLYIGSA